MDLCIGFVPCHGGSPCDVVFFLQKTINARENFMKALQMEMIASPNFDLDETLGLQAKNQVSQMQADQ